MLQKPNVSVIIPNRNMAESLEQVLRALQIQDYPLSSVEIIVVDNGSTDQSQEIAKRFPVRLLVVPSPNNPYVCRNLGIAQATHPWIVLSDSSCIPDPGFLSGLVQNATSESDLVIGNVQFDVSATSSLGEVVDSLHFTRNHEYFAVRKTFPGCSLFFHKSLIDRIGLFQTDMRSGADFRWTQKAVEAGARLVYADSARVMRKGVPFPRLLRKAHRLGWGHGTMARADKRYSILETFWRMRPPGVRYMDYVLKTRGQKELRSQWLSIWLGLWLFRFYYNLGRLHVCKSLSD